MKKVLMIFTLVLTIVISLTAGTLATYTKTLAPLEGSVAAKVFYVENSETTIANVRLAPTESTQWTFSVINYKNNVPTEVDMDLYITVNLGAKAGFDEIDGLTVGLFEGDKQYGTTIIRNGTIDVEIGKAFLANQKSMRTFTLKVLWENGLVSDQTDTHNADDQHTSKIAVTVTGKQCTHDSHADDPQDPPTDPSIIGNVTVSSSRVFVNNENMYQLSFTNISADIKNGWIIEFEANTNAPLNTIKSGSIYVTNHGSSSWNTVEFTHIGENRWRMKPVLYYYHNAVDLYQNETLTVRFASSSANKDLTISNPVVKVPYVVSGIQASFRTNYTNFYVDLANSAENSRIYGWEIAFKTNVELNTSTINPYTIEKIADNGTFKTYKIKTIVSNSGVLYLDSQTTKQIIYITSTSPMNNDTVVVKDVTFFGNPIPSTINGH